MGKQPDDIFYASGEWRGYNWEINCGPLGCFIVMGIVIVVIALLAGGHH